MCVCVCVCVCVSVCVRVSFLICFVSYSSAQEYLFVLSVLNTGHFIVVVTEETEGSLIAFVVVVSVFITILSALFDYFG